MSLQPVVEYFPRNIHKIWVIISICGKGGTPFVKKKELGASDTQGPRKLEWRRSYIWKLYLSQHWQLVYSWPVSVKYRGQNPTSQDHSLLQLNMQYVLLDDTDLYWSERWHVGLKPVLLGVPLGLLLQPLASRLISSVYAGAMWNTSIVLSNTPSATYKSFRAPEQQSECKCPQYVFEEKWEQCGGFIIIFYFNTPFSGWISQSVSNNTPHILLLTMFETYLSSNSSQAMATSSIRGMIIVRCTPGSQTCWTFHCSATGLALLVRVFEYLNSAFTAVTL